MNEGNNQAKPFLKWAGGKGQLLGQFLSRFPQELNGKGIIKLHDKSGKKRYSMENPDYNKILEFCRDKKTDLHPSCVYINGEEFMHSHYRLVAWLLKNKAINMYESELCKLYLEERNQLSHLFYPPIDIPSTATLTDVANLINKMFSV